MTALALALASVLASGEPPLEPPPSPPAPQASEVPAPAEPPTDSPPPEQPAPADAAAAPAAPSPAPGDSPGSPRARRTRELAILAGWSAVSLAGIGADGPAFRLALELVPPRSFPGVALLTGELFTGETSAGLLVRSVSLDVELWADVAPRVRLGAGLGFGLVAYRRETRREWPALIAPGARAGLEVAALRFRRGAIVLGGSAAGHIGSEPWLSASITVGFRAARARGSTPGPDGIRTE